MSRKVQEDKENCGPSGKAIVAGLAVTALGVGIGSALYYFFSKDDERQGTSSGWESQQAFRTRAATLEECSICFEVMLSGEELMELKCTHNFHMKCITPWLAEHQTCPNCRSDAD